MKRNTTRGPEAPQRFVEDAWEAVGASFERFCLSAGVATLRAMMEQEEMSRPMLNFGRDIPPVKISTR